MEATENRGRSRIFTCFRPVVDDDHEQTASLPFTGDEAAARRKRRLRRSFSAAVKAVFFKTSLLKKSRSESSKQDGEESRSNSFSKSQKIVNSTKNNKPCKQIEPVVISRTNSNRSSLLSSNSSSRRATSLASSSSVSSCSSHSRSDSDKIKRSASYDFRQMNPVSEQKAEGRDSFCGRRAYDNSLAFKMSIFLVCLFALVWGKVFAIVVCTSSWLFFAPASSHSRGHRRGIRLLDSFDDVMDSEEYKKRVIMEGLLDRNR